MKMITIPGVPAARLAEAALDDLAVMAVDEGCCPSCCGSCSALKGLLDAGALDDLVRVSPGTAGSAWWADAQVDRAFLTRAWRRTSCHTDQPNAAEQAKLPATRTVPVLDGWALIAPVDANGSTVDLVAQELRESVEYLTAP